MYTPAPNGQSNRANGTAPRTTPVVLLGFGVSLQGLGLIYIYIYIYLYIYIYIPAPNPVSHTEEIVRERDNAPYNSRCTVN